MINANALAAELGIDVEIVFQEQVLQRADREDPCIQEVQYVRYGDKFFKTDVWFQKGTFHHVGATVEVPEGSWNRLSRV